MAEESAAFTIATGIEGMLRAQTFDFAADIGHGTGLAY
jgi:hypothetical protein